MPTALVTGANSGLGFHAAARLAKEGYDRVVVVARSTAKAEEAKSALAELVGRDPFEALGADMGDLDSVRAAAAELARRGGQLDYVLLNAGMMGPSAVQQVGEGVELAMAASVVGHHVLATALLQAGLLSSTATIVIAGSEAARGDMPSMYLTDVPAFARQHTSGDRARAVATLLKGEAPYTYNSAAHYAMVKVYVAWWAAAMARRLPKGMTLNAVSPGATPGTGAAQHQGAFMRFMMERVMMPMMGLMGYTHSLDAAVDRYLVPLHWPRDRTGEFWASKPGKGYAVGPIEKMAHAHLTDEESGESLWQVLVQITGAEVASPKLASR